MAYRGDRQKQRRKYLGVTQREFCERVGCTRDTVVKWESGVSAPTSAFVEAIADALCVSIDYLYGRVDDPELLVRPARTGPPSTCDMLIPLFRLLNDEEQKTVLDFVEFLHKRG